MTAADFHDSVPGECRPRLSFEVVKERPPTNSFTALERSFHGVDEHTIGVVVRGKSNRTASGVGPVIRTRIALRKFSIL